jgi:hypothetical protein
MLAMEERRKIERFDLALPALIEVIDTLQTKKKEIHDLLTKDICEEGAFFHSPQPLPERTEVKIDLILPLNRLERIKEKRSHIRVKGVVLRSEANGMAIRFQKGYKISPL